MCVFAGQALSLPSPAGVGSGLVGGHGGDHYDEKPDPFHFQYGVHDDKYHTDFSEVRSGDEAGNIKGEYSVHLPDGRIQHVIYHADGNYGGTVMEVKYSGEASHPDIVVMDMEIVLNIELMLELKRVMRLWDIGILVF